jgi:hypothetical protein
MALEGGAFGTPIPYPLHHAGLMRFRTIEV